MQAVFMARGPAFTPNYQFHSLNNVDVYHIACRILQLNPNPYATAGSIKNLTSLFRAAESTSTSNTNTSGPNNFTVAPNNHCVAFYPYASLVLFAFVLSFFNF